MTFLAALSATVGCSNAEPASRADSSATAESFFRAVYGCAPERIGRLASPDVSLSYPIFSTLYGAPVVRGIEAVTAFSGDFCRRWSDASISVDDTIVQNDRVVLVWSFSATDQRAEDPSEARQSWGGISVFRFDESGLVLEEFGEESNPGPTARLTDPRGP